MILLNEKSLDLKTLRNNNLPFIFQYYLSKSNVICILLSKYTAELEAFPLIIFNYYITFANIFNNF